MTSTETAYEALIWSGRCEFLYHMNRPEIISVIEEVLTRQVSYLTYHIIKRVFSVGEIINTKTSLQR